MKIEKTVEAEIESKGTAYGIFALIFLALAIWQGIEGYWVSFVVSVLMFGWDAYKFFKNFRFKRFKKVSK